MLPKYVGMPPGQVTSSNCMTLILIILANSHIGTSRDCITFLPVYILGVHPSGSHQNLHFLDRPGPNNMFNSSVFFLCH